MLLKLAVVASGLAIGYWLVSRFLEPPQDAADRAPEAPQAGGETPWHAVLEVSEFASDVEVTAAYRTKIAQYHPDKVATLGPELRALAEHKSREINRAYEAAMRR